MEAVFGAPINPSDGDAPEIEFVWVVGHVEVALARPVNDRRLRALWKARQGNRATPLLLLNEGPDGLRTLGPQAADDPIRGIALDALLKTLRDIEGRPRRQAAAELADALGRRDRAGIPGVIVRGLLTKHVLTRRLRKYQPEQWRRLGEAAEKVRADRGWRENLTALGYKAEELRPRGYLLRHDERPIAVVIPMPDAAAFSRTTEEGSLPEGLLIADCRREGAGWGLLATENRFRLFPAETPIGAATGRYLEIDIAETDPDDWPYMGLLSPESLEPGGLLEELIRQSVAFGNELRDTVEEQIRNKVLPSVARGLGEWISGPPRVESLESPNVRQGIEDAALLLMFQALFFLYLESQEFLPLSSAAYGPHSATQLLADARAQTPDFDQRATTLWSRFRTLVQAMRTGNTAWGIPAYNGDLFAADGLVGAELLEEASLTDSWFGAALAALAFDPEGEDEQAGVDYGDLEIAHLGRIYEGLLSLHLSLADEPLVYDARTERWVPGSESKQAEVAEGELFYQTVSGGRKAAGVYYTPQVIVRHLVNRAVLPALDEHLGRVAAAAKKNVNDAARMLFDFRVLDPAMGSAHFLADALDRIAERIGTFLAEQPLKPISTMLDELRAEAKWGGRIEDGDLLRRLVLKRCIFGVDLSGMAVEVAKVSLWLTSFVPGLSLAYLGHNLRQGDALVGVADPRVLADLGPMFAEYDQGPIPRALSRAREVATKIGETPDRNPEEVAASRAAEEELGEVTEGLVKIFDVWCSEPFGAKGARDWIAGAADKVLAGQPAKLEDRFLHPANEMARDRSFFHWPAEFPEVFIREKDEWSPASLTTDADRLFTTSATGGQIGLHESDTTPRPGFDVVIGNPPWEELTIEELAFYALHDPGIRGLRSESDRRHRIEELVKRYPYLEAEFRRRQEDLEQKRKFFGPRGGYVAQGAGDKDLYKLFCERYRSLARTGGWLGVVLPRSTFHVDGARAFRQWLFRASEVRHLDLILNSERWAFDIHAQYSIALLAAKRVAPTSASTIRISGPSASESEFLSAEAGPGVVVGQVQLDEWTRAEGTSGFEVPLLPSGSMVGVFDKLRVGPRFDEGYDSVWSAFPVRELDETTDRKYLSHDDGVPVWKGRSFDRYEPHGADAAGYADEGETIKRLQRKRTSPQSAFKGRFPRAVLEDPMTHPYFNYRVAFRDVTNRLNVRTSIACLIPPKIFLVNSAPYFVFDEGGSKELALLLGLMNALPFDWQARRFVERHMNFYVLSLLRLPAFDVLDADAVSSRAARLSCLDDRFVAFSAEAGVDCGPLDPVDKERLRAEIDVIVARAYGLTESDLGVVFEDFSDSAVTPDYRALVRELMRGGL